MKTPSLSSGLQWLAGEPHHEHAENYRDANIGFRFPFYHYLRPRINSWGQLYEDEQHRSLNLYQGWALAIYINLDQWQDQRLRSLIMIFELWSWSFNWKSKDHDITVGKDSKNKSVWRRKLDHLKDQDHQPCESFWETKIVILPNPALYAPIGHWNCLWLAIQKICQLKRTEPRFPDWERKKRFKINHDERSLSR